MERDYCGLRKQRLIVEHNTSLVYLGVRRMYVPMVARPYIGEILPTLRKTLYNQSINQSAFHSPIVISGIYSRPKSFFFLTLISRDLRQSETRESRNI